MKSFIIALICLFTASASAQLKITDTIRSQKLGEDRVITIGVPESYKSNPAKKYPLLVLLDGDYLFDPFQGALSYGAYWDDLPEMIIVGIHQNKGYDRETDTAVDKQTGLPEEKGSQFFEFIGEVVTAMEKQYRIAPFKIIAGHDLTAGFLNLYLYKEQPLFTGYIALSPELPAGMEEQLPERFSAITKPIFYYHSSADGDIKKMQARNKKLDDEVKKIKKPTLNYKFDEFKGSSHYSMVLHSIPSALYQFFAAYQPISSSEFNEKIAPLPNGYVDYLINKYSEMEKALGMDIQVRINDFKAIEAAILKNKAYDEFEKLSSIAKKNYPKSMLADYHLGMMYEKKGDLKRAAKAYQSAFQKEEIGDLTKDMMLDKSEDLKNR